MTLANQPAAQGEKLFLDGNVDFCKRGLALKADRS
jgi:hypothetical protein